MINSIYRHGTRRKGALVIVVACVSVIPFAASARADSRGDRGVEQTVSSSTPPPDTISLAGLHALQSAAHASPTAVRTAGPAVVQPYTGTPDGYALRNPGYRRSDHVYDSDTMYQAVYRCPTDQCTIEAATKAQFHEYVVGTTSKRWQLKMTMSEYENPAGLSWSYSSTYYCGVNISGGSDHICGNGASASGTYFDVNEAGYRDFEHVNNNTVFPMMSATTLFSTGAKVTEKFRGWDVLNRASSTKLNQTSGTGH